MLRNCYGTLRLPPNTNGRVDSLRRDNICVATVRIAAFQLHHSAIVKRVLKSIATVEESLLEVRIKLNRLVIVLDEATPRLK